MRYLVTSSGDANTVGDKSDGGDAIPNTCDGANICGGGIPSNGGGAIPTCDGPSRGGVPT